ncbi:MAG: IclR family transcriptional regulator C-terminal domain-containing protein [Pseudomonadota bacterium]
MKRKQTHFIQALARGLSILQAFSSDRPSLTLTQLAQLTGMNRTAVQRFTDTLVDLGFLVRNRHKEFFLGPQVLSLGYAYLGSSQLRRLAATYVNQASEAMDCTMNLAILDDLEVIFVHRHEVRRYLKFDLQPGSKLPAPLTASGKVLLAALADGDLRERLTRMDLQAVTSCTITDREALWADLMETRRTGLGACDRELSLDLYSMGVPLLNAVPQVVAAVNLSMPAAEVPSPLWESNRQGLMALGRELSALFGYQGPYPAMPVGPSQGGVL